MFDFRFGDAFRVGEVCFYDVAGDCCRYFGQVRVSVVVQDEEEVKVGDGTVACGAAADFQRCGAGDYVGASAAVNGFHV